MEDEIRKNLGLQELPKFAVTLTIPNVDLLRIFGNLKSLFKKTDLSKTVNIVKKDSTLLMRAQTVVKYEAYPIILGTADDTDFSVTIVYQDITPLLPTSGTCELLVTTSHLEFKTENGTFTFDVKDANDIQIPVIAQELESLDVSKAKEAIKTANQFKPIISAYKRGTNYNLANNLLMMRLPSIWADFLSSDLNFVITDQLALVLEEFIHDVSSISIVYTETWIALKKNIATLYIPLSEKNTIKELQTSGHAYVGTFDITQTISKINDLQRVYGKEVIKIVLGKDKTGIMFQTSTTKIEYRIPDTVEDTFAVRIDFFIAIAKALGNKLEVYEASGSRILKSEKGTVLFSVV